MLAKELTLQTYPRTACLTIENTEKASLINHINNKEKNVPSYQREEKEIPFQSCKSAPTFSEQDSSSPAFPDNIFLALWKLTKSQQREWACYSKLNAHPKILLAEHLVGLTVTFPNLRPF